MCSMFFFRLPDYDPTESESRQRMAFDLRRRESKDLALLSRIVGDFNLRVSGKDWAGVSQGKKMRANSQIPVDFIFALLANSFTSIHSVLLT